MTGVVDQALGMRDLSWLSPDGSVLSNEHWADAGMRSFGMLLDGSARASAIARRGQDATVLLLFNGRHGGAEFTLPALPGRAEAADAVWSRRFDTALDQQAVVAMAREQRYVVSGRSVVALAAAGSKAAAESLKQLLQNLP